MLNPSEFIINSFIDRLVSDYRLLFRDGPDGHAETIVQVAHQALNRISLSNALYHDMDHTQIVTLVGQDMLRGRNIRDGDVTSLDWVHFVCSLLCFAIGFSRDICDEDDNGICIINDDGDTVTLPRGATDGFLWPYFADRGKIYVRQHFQDHPILDWRRLSENIEYARFPPRENENLETATFPGMLRAAHYIGAIADPNFMLKIKPLMLEIEESGLSELLGTSTVSEFRKNFSSVYWNALHPKMIDGIEFLKLTEQGRSWLANMHADILTLEYEGDKN